MNVIINDDWCFFSDIATIDWDAHLVWNSTWNPKEHDLSAGSVHNNVYVYVCFMDGTLCHPILVCKFDPNLP